MKKLSKALAILLTLVMLLSGCTSGQGGGASEASGNSTTGDSAGDNADSDNEGIFVEPIENMSEDFILGADISSLLSQEESGVKYYTADGTEEDLLQLLKEGGTNWIRLRVWNDPFDAEGHGYGGGNCDAERMGELAVRATEAGMKVLIDFHYSDFWADPNKQMVPKAWADMTLEEKETAIHDYTVEALSGILDKGADVAMVQIGNEINNGLSGETNMSRIVTLLKSAATAVREVAAAYGKDIKIAVHYTSVDNAAGIYKKAAEMASGGLDYDVFGISYYIFWHDSLENAQKVLQTLSATYGVETVIMETSYEFTAEDGDGSGNSVDAGSAVDGYEISVQGQANVIHDVCQMAANAGALGVFYWEPAWTPVNHYDASAADAASVLAVNQAAWEEFGSGWASSYASEYDPNDAGRYYGGSSWDNQAWFDFDSKALPSLYTYKYLRTGASGTLAVESVETPVLELMVGEALSLPETVEVRYNDRTKSGPVKVTWNEEEASKVDTSEAGAWVITGTLEGIDTVTARCEVYAEFMNLAQNPSFEDSDRSMWVATSNAGVNPTDFQKKAGDAYDGEFSLHFWDSKAMDFAVTQTITIPADGTYSLEFMAQGGDIGASDEFLGIVMVNGETYSTKFTLDGWVNWQDVLVDGIELKTGDEVTFGVSVKASAGAWGTFDDFSFRMQPE